MVLKVVHAYLRDCRKKIWRLWSLLQENKNLSRVASHRKSCKFSRAGRESEGPNANFLQFTTVWETGAREQAVSCTALTAEMADCLPILIFLIHPPKNLDLTSSVFYPYNWTTVFITRIWKPISISHQLVTFAK